MSIFTISDLHLSFSSDKPMNIFKGWDNHTDRLKANWKRLVKENDTVILPGDFSWALKLEDTLKDFQFLESLPGKKLIFKGNHDLWWSTAKKLNTFFEENNIKTVEIIFNNCKIVEGYAVAGTRGWFYDDTSNKKVLLREAGRLRASINEAKKLLNSTLKVKSSKEVYIPTDFGTEVFAYEYHCVAPDEKEILVYINPKTGVEEEILILLYSDNGVLTK